MFHLFFIYLSLSLSSPPLSLSLVIEGLEWLRHLSHAVPAFSQAIWQPYLKTDIYVMAYMRQGEV